MRSGSDIERRGGEETPRGSSPRGTGACRRDSAGARPPGTVGGDASGKNSLRTGSPRRQPSRSLDRYDVASLSVASLVAALLLSSSVLSGAPVTEASDDGTTRRGFEVTVSRDAQRAVSELGLETPVGGRLYLIFSRDGAGPPREQVGIHGVPFFGTDVDGLAPTGSASVEADAGLPEVVGYPLERIADLPAGEYTVQAFLNVYTTFRRGDGHTVRLHLNSGAGQDPWHAPGNLYSRPRTVTLGQGAESGEAGGSPVRLTLSEVIPPVEPLGPDDVLQQGNPRDTRHVKFVKLRSETLSRFWGRPIHIGANVLLPRDYDSRPGARYPVIYLQGHFPGRRAPFGFVEPAEEGEDGSPRGPESPKVSGDTGGDEAGPGRRRRTEFTRFWLSEEAPRMVVVTFRDANPYYDTSYSVDSANVGPYGTALTEELIPHLERRFRIRSEPWARALAGGSTGGWEALALQVFHPAIFGATWAWCPDPVDFRYYQIVDLHSDDNAYYREHAWTRVERPNARRPDGNVVSTIRQENRYELAVGTRGRSAGQWAIWEATFGPVGEDGYPRRIWDPLTGAIDRDVAAHWKERFDLNRILQRDWPTLGPRVRGEIHVAVGDMDTYYLEEAVYLLEEFLSSVEDPPAEASFEYGRRQPHCWIGASPDRPGREMSHAEFVRIAADELTRSAPPHLQLFEAQP